MNAQYKADTRICGGLHYYRAIMTDPFVTATLPDLRAGEYKESYAKAGSYLARCNTSRYVCSANIDSAILTFGICKQLFSTLGP